MLRTRPCLDPAGGLPYPVDIMSWSLSGKVVWITGASSGIGRSLAVEAARRGAWLILSGRNVPALEETAALCERARLASENQQNAQKDEQEASPGARNHAACTLLPFDLADPEARLEAAQKALTIHGRIDVLMLNAGVSQRAKFVETSADVFNLIMETNFFAAVDIVRAVLPQMCSHSSGVIACVSSVAGLMGAPWRTAYSASKHAQAGFFSSLRTELYGSGIQISIVYPGFVRTAISENALAGDGTRHGKLDPLQKFGQNPEVTARTIWDKLETGKLDIKVAFELKARLGVFLSRYFPALFVRSISRHGGL
ncbi:Oxidoreductase, short chain dehydrogenase [uncultured spirochete]|jgi:Short-chain dehydrogenases of various substrate specificities|uniref:Oxidoreductase, short chain dehydrogenase n=2 Tax=Spirochaetales TaxID=136 RepID=A0A3P3XHE1_9SPIR|nr:Oxidoreductase, short chain dehydrogenase [uncultured spirochete]HBE47181.1 short-chain dehydrogenase [Spirochaetaceae bacterium]